MGKNIGKKLRIRLKKLLNCARSLYQPTEITFQKVKDEQDITEKSVVEDS